MALTEEEVLLDAGEAVTEVVTALSEQRLTYKKQVEILKDTSKVFLTASKIIDQMLKDKKPPALH